MLARCSIAIVAALAAAPVGAASSAKEVSIRQLVTHPELYSGKAVAVTGWFECAFEAGCELRFTRARQEHLTTIRLDFPDDLAKALDKTTPLTGWLRVVGRFEYSPPTPDHVIHKADPHVPGDRQAAEVWQGFGFRAFQIKVSHFTRI
jgi:hypothetical protein